MAGTMGDIGTTSFFPSKNLGCYGDGGAIFTNSDHLASEMRMIANHGQSVRYYHDRIGVNSRLDSIQAAILRCKLPHLDAYCDARRAAADFYDKAFAEVPEIKTPVRDAQSTHVFHQYTLQLSEGIGRDELVDYLQAQEIPCMIYYPVALNMQTAYRDDRYTDGSFPVTESLVQSVFSLPMHTELTNEQLTKITTAVVDFIKNNRK
jgi:UDP-2-acetamido-2-deoxy-ribo-hexuluronate aminotransferase